MDETFSISDSIKASFVLVKRYPMGVLLPIFLVILLETMLFLMGLKMDKIISMLLFFTTLFITYGVSQVLKGELYPSFVDAYGGISGSIGRSIGVGAAVYIPMVIIIILVAIGAVAMQSNGSMLPFIVGIILLFVWLIFAIMTTVAISVCIIEKRGALQSIWRSVDLTKGYRIRIFFTEIIAIFITVVPVAILSRVIETFATTTVSYIVLQLLLVPAIGVITVLPTIIYYGLLDCSAVVDDMWDTNPIIR